jgi:hypothetical protein
MREASGPARSGMRRLEPSGRRKHARGAATPHHSQGAKDVEEASATHTGSLRPRQSPMRHFTNEGDGCFEAGQGLKGDRAKRVSMTVMVPKVVMQLFLVPACSGATGVPGGAMHVAGRKRVIWPWWVMAVEVPACPGTVGGARALAHLSFPPTFATGGQV